MKKQCQFCKKEFNALINNNKFCSRICYYRFRKVFYIGKKSPKWKGGICNKKLICELCGKTFLGYYTRRFCGRNCQTSWKSKGYKNCNWKGGKKKSGKGYIGILKPEHPFSDKTGYIMEHRLIMEKKIGRYLTEKEVVHHINGIRNDNRIINLKLLHKKEHDRISRQSRYEKEYFNHREKISCDFCKNIFYRKKSRIRYKNNFCSNKCYNFNKNKFK